MASMFKLFKSVFSLEPGWAKSVIANGLPAQATIITPDPQTIVKGIGGYEGRDGWTDLQVTVYSANEPPYEAKMICKLSQVVFGMLAGNQTVNVKIDPKDKAHVILSDDVHTLLQARVKK